MLVNRPEEHKPNYNPIDFKHLTKVEGPLVRHIEQLWDEVKKLKERVSELEEILNGMD